MIDVTKMSKYQFEEFFREQLEVLTGLCFNECFKMSCGMAVFGDEATIKALWANPEWQFHVRDLDYDPDYGWSLVVDWRPQ